MFSYQQYLKTPGTGSLLSGGGGAAYAPPAPQMQSLLQQGAAQPYANPGRMRMGALPQPAFGVNRDFGPNSLMPRYSRPRPYPVADYGPGSFLPRPGYQAPSQKPIDNSWRTGIDPRIFSWLEQNKGLWDNNPLGNAQDLYRRWATDLQAKINLYPGQNPELDRMKAIILHERQQRLQPRPW